mmetsp:Transcript_2097/g.1970  ORF Transcript_2097/g.1970 Transcript_2097/m.1970 type:complete len:87 (+) Transcript_2097:421-681(+)
MLINECPWSSLDSFNFRNLHAYISSGSLFLSFLIINLISMGVSTTKLHSFSLLDLYKNLTIAALLFSSLLVVCVSQQKLTMKISAY